MIRLLLKTSQNLLTTIAIVAAIATDYPQTKDSYLIQKDLFFDLNLPEGKQVSETEFAAFVDNNITPRFPDGLTIFDARRQFGNSSGKISETFSKVVTLFIEDSDRNQIAIERIAAAYREEFEEKNILKVTNKDELKVGFGAGENLIENNPNPEFIEVNLFFGRSMPNGKEVSQREFANFVDNNITPRFPNGFTIFDADGQYRDRSNTIIQEPSQVVTLLLKDTLENEIAIDEIIKSYIQQFDQESVLLAVNEDITVSFGAENNLIDNDINPESIEVNLFLKDNYAPRDRVSDNDLDTFIKNVITPRFPNGLTIFKTEEQFRDSNNRIIAEESIIVSLLFYDTIDNEIALNQIIRAYLEQFDRENILVVVDEEIEVSF
ncbi:MAG: DUF3574 domain-containing protein [Prochloraceae cyanobacterium]